MLAWHTRFGCCMDGEAGSVLVHHASERRRQPLARWLRQEVDRLSAARRRCRGSDPCTHMHALGRHGLFMSGGRVVETLLEPSVRWPSPVASLFL